MREKFVLSLPMYRVALRKESVDRNQGVHYDNYNLHCVALRKESVDRNPMVAGSLITLGGVALRKESVDRNKRSGGLAAIVGVALRKESVDRNCDLQNLLSNHEPSLSARRAWIEIALARGYVRVGHGRSPQGERG